LATCSWKVLTTCTCHSDERDRLEEGKKAAIVYVSLSMHDFSLIKNVRKQLIFKLETSTIDKRIRFFIQTCV